MLLNVMDVKGLPMLSGVDASWVMKGVWPNRFNAVEGVRGIPDFYWSGAQTILLDVGNRGGALPAGYEWY